VFAGKKASARGLVMATSGEFGKVVYSQETMGPWTLQGVWALPVLAERSRVKIAAIPLEDLGCGNLKS
jgi:hypothetical protein